MLPKTKGEVCNRLVYWRLMQNIHPKHQTKPAYPTEYSAGATNELISFRLLTDIDQNYIYTTPQYKINYCDSVFDKIKAQIVSIVNTQCMFKS